MSTPKIHHKEAEPSVALLDDCSLSPKLQFPRRFNQLEACNLTLYSGYIYVPSTTFKNQIKGRRIALNCTLNLSLSHECTLCNFKVSMEKYVLAFVTHKLMHGSMKPHLYFTGGV